MSERLQEIKKLTEEARVRLAEEAHIREEKEIERKRLNKIALEKWERQRVEHVTKKVLERIKSRAEQGKNCYVYTEEVSTDKYASRLSKGVVNNFPDFNPKIKIDRSWQEVWDGIDHSASYQYPTRLVVKMILTFSW